MHLTVTLTVAIGVFLVAAVVVIIAAIALEKSGDVIASRTGWGRLWVGSLLLAGATSLPELVTSVAAVRLGAPALAVGTVFGANLFNMSKLVVLAALLGKRDVYQRVVRGQALLAALALGLTVLATLFVAIQLDVKWLILDAASLMLLAGYVAGNRVLYRFGTGLSGETEEEEEATHSSVWGWPVFALCAVAIFVAAPLLASSAERTADLTGISQSFIGVLSLAIVSSLPELIVVAAALRAVRYDLAISVIYGSNAFNIAALAVAAFFHSPGSIFGNLDTGAVVAGLFASLLMLLGTVQLLLRRPLKHISLTEPSTTLMFGLYLLGTFLVFTLS